MAVKVANCVVCAKNEDVKYKCPTCRSTYCSVACCREHKLTCAAEKCREQEESTKAAASEAVSSVAAATRPKYDFPTEDTVPLEQLEHLRNSQKLKDMLANPHLRRIMESIDDASDAAGLISEAMKEPIFCEMADECLRVIHGEQEAESGDEFS